MNTDKIYLVTGGTSGVGKAIATGIAETGATVVLVSRNELNGRAAVKEISATTGNENVSFLVADLSRLHSVFLLSEQYKARYPKLDGLINAAGAWYFKKELTEDNLDKSFVVNYLSHFALTHFLMDTLKSAEGARVVTIGGATRFLKKTGLDLHELQFPKSFGMKTILSSMLARIYFGFELADRLEGTNVSSIIVHPGFVKSNIGRSVPWWLKILFSLSSNVRNAPSTCESGVFAALETNVGNGVFIDDQKNIVDIRSSFRKETGENLWVLSEKLLSSKTKQI